MDMSDVILDGEAIVLTADKRPVRFQETMKGLGSAVPFFFDILYLDGASLLDQPYSVRTKLLPVAHRPPHIITADADAARSFFDAANAAGPRIRQVAGAGNGSRSRRRTRSISSCSPPSGATAAAMASSRTCTSARVTRAAAS
jgi:hypothetical protein